MDTSKIGTTTAGCADHAVGFSQFKPPHRTLNLSELTTRTAWIRTIDPDAELTVEHPASLWMLFSGDAESVANAPSFAFTCIDIQSDDAWITWDDASDDQRASATLFRYLLIAD